MASYVDTFKRFSVFSTWPRLYFTRIRILNKKNTLLHVRRSVYFTISIGKNNPIIFFREVINYYSLPFFGRFRFGQIRVFTKSKHTLYTRALSYYYYSIYYTCIIFMHYSLYNEQRLDVNLSM
jgi:hypothetical protein